MATLVVGQSGRYVGQDTVGTATVASAIPTGPTRIVPPQTPTGAVELIGYALLFTSALMPAANTIAAAEYQVGTHQAAIAASQDRSWVRGTPFTLIPVAGGDTILRPLLVAAPQQRDDAYALTFHAPLTYSAVVVPPPSTLVAAPEQIDGAYARLTAPPLSYLSVVGPTATTLQAGEQVDPSPFLPPSWVHGTPDTLIPVQVGDTLPPQTWIAAPEQVDGAYALTFNLPLSYVAVVTAPPVTITVEPQAFDAAYALTFKTPVQYLAVVAPLAGTVVSLQEQADTYLAAQTFGPEPPAIVVAGDVLPPKTIVVWPQVPSDLAGSGWTFKAPPPDEAVVPPIVPEPPIYAVGPLDGNRDSAKDREQLLERIRREDEEIILFAATFIATLDKHH